MKIKNNNLAGSKKIGTSQLFKNLTPYLGLIPFGLITLIFLIWPTIVVVYGSLQNLEGGFGFGSLIEVFTNPKYVGGYWTSIKLSAYSAIAGAILGGLLSWAISTGKSDGRFRKIAMAASGVLAQFGGVMLTFAFLATFGFNGMITLFANNYFGENILTDASWLYSLTGLVVVYTFFQIPLMLIVFLPAMENMKPEWREASESLGGSTVNYWTKVAGPILLPSFLGALLLLFANSFSAYATAAALISQGSPITPLQISFAISGEVSRTNPGISKALAVGMILVIIIVMTIYFLLQKRVSKWVKV
jgi:putative spermidine/putrescine transport system permease protein